MTLRIRRWLLSVTALLSAFVGGWALLAPRSWYDSFPGFGLHWLPVLGPYNEHLARDVGGLYLAMTVLSIGVARRPADEQLARLAGVAWLVFSIPHLIYHVLHLDMYGVLDQVLNVLALGYFLLVGGLLLVRCRVPAAKLLTDQ